MPRKSDAAHTLPPVSEDQVAAFLKANPDLLLRRPDLLAALELPRRWDGAEPVVDLQDAMIGKLRRDLDEMRGCAEHLITTTRQNMSTQARTHQAALAVLDQPSLAALARIVVDDLPGLLDVDACSLAFEGGLHATPALAVAGIHPLSSGAVAELMGDPGREVELRASTYGDPAVFGAAASLVRSFALVRLVVGENGPEGVLALGSRQERAFHPNQGNDLLVFLGSVVEHCVRRWLDA